MSALLGLAEDVLMGTRLRELLGGAEGKVEYLRPDFANGVWHWERMQVNLYGYDLWAYLRVWMAHRPDIWLTWNGSWEFVKQSKLTMDTQSVYAEMDVSSWRVFDEHHIHVMMLRSVI